jgi:valine--pyruvate aminotransferase
LGDPTEVFRFNGRLGQALNNNPNLLFLGGGNPAQIPSVQAIFQHHWQVLGADSRTL